MTRKLVTLRQIEKIEPIPKADRIEKITIGGWELVSQKGIHTVGDWVLYYEVDSLLPIQEPYIDTFESRGRKKTQLDDGTILEGYRLRTIKLRGQISQGFILSLTLFPEIDFKDKEKDYAKILGVHKYEVPESPADREANKERIPTTGFAKFKYKFTKFLERKFPKVFKKLKFKSAFPDFLRKSDQERCQNLKNQIWKAYEAETLVQVSYKLDGSSITIARNGKEEFTCSRNLRKNPKQKTDAFIVEGDKIHQKFKKNKLIGNYAFQGELCGPKIQKNFEGLMYNQVYVYSMIDIETRKYLNPKEVLAICNQYDIPHVPILASATTLQSMFPTAIDADDLIKQILKHADGPSGVNGKYREGFVYKALDDSGFSFKAISNSYLLKLEAAMDQEEAEAIEQAKEEVSAD